MPVTTNTRKLAALLGASGAGIATDGTLTSTAIGEVIVAGDIADDAVGTAELANDVTISTSGNIATTGSGTLTVAGTTTLTGNTTHNGNVIMATTKKVQQKGAFMQSSTHQVMVLGG
jgi:hypothetical protein